jgi:hypothetical protein
MAALILLAITASLGVVVGLFVLAATSTTRMRRAQLERENTRLRDELASPADPGSTRWAASTADYRVTAPSHQPAERPSEPLYEEAKRAARLRSDWSLLRLSTDDRARSRHTDEHVRRF